MKYLLTTIFLLVSAGAFAMSSADSARHFWVGFQGGAGVGVCRDLGYAPITFKGQELSPALLLRSETAERCFMASLGGFGGGYGFRLGMKYMQAYGGQPEISFLMLRKVYESGLWRVWLGGGIDDRCDIRYLPALGNNCTGVSNFFDVNLVGRIDCRWRRWIFSGQMGLTPFSLVCRPGFAYMDNYDQELGDPSANLFDQYHHYVALATGITTRMGITYEMKNSNRAGVEYRWNYLTSRTSELCPHLFQEAGHALLFELDFAL